MSNILAIDSSTPVCSIAIKSDDKFISLQHEGSRSQNILQLIYDGLNELSVEFSKLDLLVYGQGPGSFTGLRIGCAVMQGLTMATNAKIVGFSSLQILAQQAYAKTKAENILPVIDAKKQQVFFGKYQVSEGIAKPMQPDQVVDPKDLLNCQDYLLVGDGLLEYKQLTRLICDLQIIYPDATYLIELAKNIDEYSEIALPTYVRSGLY